MPNKPIGKRCKKCEAPMQWRPIASMWVCFKCRERPMNLYPKHEQEYDAQSLWFAEAFSSVNAKSQDS